MFSPVVPDAIPVENLAPVVAASGFIPLLITAIQVFDANTRDASMYALLAAAAAAGFGTFQTAARRGS